MASTSDSSPRHLHMRLFGLSSPPNYGYGDNNGPPSKPALALFRARCSPTSRDAHYARARLKGSLHPHRTPYP
ncbi:hypothetical protein ACLOJK_026981 [Asimina triloba]